jgi:FkbM family methyltransferase
MLDITQAYGLTFLFPAGDLIVGRSLRVHGEFARPEVDLIRAYLGQSESGTFVDVGANIGAIALPVAAAFPAWRTIAVEAHRGLAQVLGANALNNRLHNLEVHHAAMGPEERIASFSMPDLKSKGNFGGLGMHGAEAMEPVRMWTLDAAAPADTRFVKIDVEGFELEVLKGAARTVEARQAVWLFEAKARTPTMPDTLAVFLEAGYRLFWFFAPFVTPTAPKMLKRELHLDGDFNCVALPPGVPNLWDLPALTATTDRPPTDISHFRYLTPYGYT